MKRLVLETVGWILVVVGLAALVLPGPGLIMLVAGLALLSQQYEWAEKRLEPARVQARRVASESVSTIPRIALSVLGALTLGALGVLWLVDPPVPDRWPLPDGWWLLGGIGTGVSLLLSSALALTLIVISILQFRTGTRGANGAGLAAETGEASGVTTLTPQERSQGEGPGSRA